MSGTGFYGIQGLAQLDAVGMGAALVLLAMSFLAWYIVFTKAWRMWQVKRRNGEVILQFWSAPNLEEATYLLRDFYQKEPATHLAVGAVLAAQHHQRHRERAASLGDQSSLSDLIVRTLRQVLARENATLESGLSILASIGAVSPFVGLFGTVWGIYHTLLGISAAGGATLDKVAGPVGEALIMTAAGLAVAIPAVLAYNAFVRIIRTIVCGLDGFAHDLHTYLTTGAKLDDKAAPETPPKPGLKGMSA